MLGNGGPKNLIQLFHKHKEFPDDQIQIVILDTLFFPCFRSLAELRCSIESNWDMSVLARPPSYFLLLQKTISGWYDVIRMEGGP